MIQDKSELKQPVGIYVLAALFLLAPLGNILVSFAGSGVEGWYRPSEFMQLVQSIPLADWMWLAGIFISGVTLLLRHKAAWLVAVLALFLVLAMNTYRAFTLDETVMNSEFIRMQILVSILVTFSVLIIAFYARYPYLDRRQQWMFPTAHRYNYATKVLVHVGNNALSGVTESLSTSGVRIHIEGSAESLKNQTHMDVTLTEMENMKIHAEVIELNGNTLRVQFRKFRWAERGRLEGWLKSKIS